MANFSPSPWPAAAATLSAEFLHKGSAERKHSWDWQSKRSFYSAVRSTGHVKTEPECNHPTTKKFSSQFACLGCCGLKMDNKQLGNLDCSADWNLIVYDGFDMILCHLRAWWHESMGNNWGLCPWGIRKSCLFRCSRHQGCRAGGYWGKPWKDLQSPECSAESSKGAVCFLWGSQDLLDFSPRL